MKILSLFFGLGLALLHASAQETPPNPSNPPQRGGPPVPGNGARPGPDGQNRRPAGPGMQQDGPWNHNLHQAVLGPDGAVQSQGFWIQSGGVPSLVQDEKKRLIATFQWFPQGERELFDQVALSISSDGGKAWTTPRKAVIKDFPDGLRRPYDPTLAVSGEGKLRLYFTSHQGQGPEASVIHSALSTDGGESFTFEPGIRFAVEGTGVMDCAVTKLGERWHLLCPKRGGGAFHATSADGLTFERTADIQGERGQQWIGNLTVAGDKLRFWMGSPEGVTGLESADGISWTAAVRSKFRGMDPAALPLEGGLTLLIGTAIGAPPGPGRPGVPRPNGPRPPREPDAGSKRER